ncbi:MAG: hypothetical protein O2955_04370 [Planctomycetota bacterium]|nr:hypothetical protein [Planctomycetota bacterium]MDA1211725.1 hypothetical protein [Planctomycetota bacterium]
MKQDPASILMTHLQLTILLVAAMSAMAPFAVADEPTGRDSARENLNKAAQFSALQPASNKDRFDFETERMRGTIRLDGAYHGVTELVDKATGRQVINSKLSALNLYRLMSVNRVMGVPRYMNRTTKSAINWVEATWPPSDAHLGEVTSRHQGQVTARYQISSPQAIDLTITVESRGTYAGYELFLSNYFDKSLIPYVYLKPVHGSKQSSRDLVQPIVPTVNDVFRGTLLVFPRDAHAARLGLDGRWDLTDIQLCPVRHYADCLAVLADSERKLGVVLMSHPRDCFALSTRYHAERDEDRLTTYSAFDLSLFGNDLLPDNRRTVKVRLALTALDENMSQPLELYRAFVSERDAERDPVNLQEVAK